MVWTPRRVAATLAVAGALIVGGAGWAAAQDAPTTSTPNSGSTSTTESPGSPGGGQHSGNGNCPHMNDGSSGSSSGGSSGQSGSGSGSSAESSAFRTT